MTIETYYNFIKIIECGSIFAASQDLMIAQPALSTQLRNLERSLGTKLIERSSKKLTLTPAGKIFYQKAQLICELNASMHKEIESYTHGASGVLKLSMTPSNPLSLLHTLFDNFVAAHPDVTYQFDEALSDQVAENVRTGISEIGMIRSPIPRTDDFHIIPFNPEEIMCILSKKNPLADNASLTLSQIKNERIVTTDVIAPMIVQAFRSINSKPNFYLKTTIRRTALFWT